MAARMGSMAAMSFDEMKGTLEGDRSFGGPLLEAGEGFRRQMVEDGFGRRDGGPRGEERSRVHRAERSGGHSGDDYEELLRLDEANVKRGLSLAAIRGLPKRAVRAGEVVEDLITRTNCPEGSIVYDLPCGHSFGKQGALRWFQSSRNCPVCRREIEP